jgi:hypothetical protein
VRSVRDVRLARRREAAAAEARAAEDRAAAARVRAAERDRQRGVEGPNRPADAPNRPADGQNRPVDPQNRRAPENAQNDHAHRHFTFRRGAAGSDRRMRQDEAAAAQQPGYQPTHLDERSSGAGSAPER